MINYPAINPIAVSLGPLKIYWYGIMYLIGFFAAWVLAQYRARQNVILTKNQATDLIFYCALGVVLGGRVGYILFYNFSGFVQHPLSLFKIWQGGMSFHGGFLGVFLAIYLYARSIGQPVFKLTDFIVPLVPIGLGAGRIGNFINGELFGKITNLPWAMIFPNGGPFPRHPSQLYEFFLEGILLFVILWTYSEKPRAVGKVSGVFLIFYGAFRFFAEFFRQPDPQIGFIAWNWLTMGQLLSIPMILLGFVLFFKPNTKH